MKQPRACCPSALTSSWEWAPRGCEVPVISGCAVRPPAPEMIGRNAEVSINEAQLV